MDDSTGPTAGDDSSRAAAGSAVDSPETPAEIEAALREQLTATFGQAAYPLGDPFELLPLLPDGPQTEFRAGPVVVPAVDFGLAYKEYQSYPYDSVESLVDDLIAALKAEDELPDHQ